MHGWTIQNLGFRRCIETTILLTRCKQALERQQRYDSLNVTPEVPGLHLQEEEMAFRSDGISPLPEQWAPAEHKVCWAFKSSRKPRARGNRFHKEFWDPFQIHYPSKCFLLREVIWKSKSMAWLAACLTLQCMIFGIHLKPLRACRMCLQKRPRCPKTSTRRGWEGGHWECRIGWLIWTTSTTGADLLPVDPAAGWNIGKSVNSENVKSGSSWQFRRISFSHFCRWLPTWWRLVQLEESKDFVRNFIFAAERVWLPLCIACFYAFAISVYVLSIQWSSQSWAISAESARLVHWGWNVDKQYSAALDSERHLIAILGVPES